MLIHDYTISINYAMFRDIFYFNRQDRIATIVLLAVIVACHVAQSRMPQKPDSTLPNVDTLFYNGQTQAKDTLRYRRSRNVYEDRKSTAKRGYSQYSSKETHGRNTADSAYVALKSQQRDTAFTPRYRIKQRPTSAVDLNAVDSLTLTGLPGIGAWTALRIMDYRENLGGFTSVGQLLEIEGLQDSLLQWFTLTDTVPIRKLPVNELSVADLRRHPYIDFYQARAIVEYRNEMGKLKGPGQLSLMDEFTERDLERLAPYLDYR